MAKLSTIYFDTFRSWRDRLPEHGTCFQLFTGHGLEQAGSPVTNFPPGGSFSPMSIKHVGVRLQASSDKLRQSLIEHSSFRLWIDDKIMGDYPTNLLGAKAKGVIDHELPEDPFADDENSRAVFIKLEEAAPMPARASMYLELRFGKPLAARLSQMFHDRGPVADWVKIVGYIAGPLDKVDH